VSGSTQCALFVGDGKKYTVFGVTYSFKRAGIVRVAPMAASSSWIRKPLSAITSSPRSN